MVVFTRQSNLKADCFMRCGTREARLPIFLWFVSCSAPWSIVLLASLWLDKDKQVAVSVALGHCLASWLTAADLPADSYVSECTKRWHVAAFLWEITFCYPIMVFGETWILGLSVPVSVWKLISGFKGLWEKKVWGQMNSVIAYTSFPWEARIPSLFKIYSSLNYLSKD